ncbi:MAG: DUF222 domain-containing protein, partial [Actinobacteria bacterium]|nr:DUF222 domain-containing protein [Actinomycetota bacterium]
CRAEYLAEAERVGAARKQGYRSATEWLAALSGEPGSACRRQVAVASALESMPVTRQAFGAGEVSESKVRVLAQAQALAPEQFAKDEKALVDRVKTASAQQTPRLVAAWKRQTNPEGAEAEAERLHQLRTLYLSEGLLGMLHLSGDLDPESGLIVRHALEALADPANLNPQDGRTPAQVRADALVDICRHHLDGSNGGRRPPRVLVTIPWNTLQTGAGIVDTEPGPIGGDTARRLTCDATISRVLLDPDSVPVDMGRATRVIPPTLRKALELRDRGCAHPGCRMPARFCDAHHIIHWADGGETVLANLQLLCRQHHRQAHHHQPHPRRE